MMMMMILIAVFLSARKYTRDANEVATTSLLQKRKRQENEEEVVYQMCVSLSIDKDFVNHPHDYTCKEVSVKYQWRLSIRRSGLERHTAPLCTLPLDLTSGLNNIA